MLRAASPAVGRYAHDRVFGCVDGPAIHSARRFRRVASDHARSRVAGPVTRVARHGARGCSAQLDRWGGMAADAPGGPVHAPRRLSSGAADRIGPRRQDGARFRLRLGAYAAVADLVHGCRAHLWVRSGAAGAGDVRELPDRRHVAPIGPYPRRPAVRPECPVRRGVFVLGFHAPVRACHPRRAGGDPPAHTPQWPAGRNHPPGRDLAQPRAGQPLARCGAVRGGARPGFRVQPDRGGPRWTATSPSATPR